MHFINNKFLVCCLNIPNSLDNNGILDKVYSTDNYGAVVLDSNGEAHVFYGVMMYADDDLTDGSF